MRFILLLALLICILAYVRAQQPATWNSWMVAIGANSFVEPATSSDADASTASTQTDTAPPPPPPPPRVVPVGGLLRNGNFVAGEGYWQGDGTADPSGKGLVVTLSQSAWTRVYQKFPDQGTNNSIEVTYKLSPGLTVSHDPADYTDICKRLQIAGFEQYGSLAISPGQFYGAIGDPATGHIANEVYSANIGSTGVQDYPHDYPGVDPSQNTIFVLAFPPGTGTVTLLTAYVKNR